MYTVNDERILTISAMDFIDTNCTVLTVCVPESAGAVDTVVGVAVAVVVSAPSKTLQIISGKMGFEAVLALYKHAFVFLSIEIYQMRV